MDEGSAQALIASYRGTARAAAAVAQTHGFRALQVWQPTIHTTRKVITPSGRAVLEQIASDPFRSRLLPLHRAIAADIGSAVATVPGVDFVNLRGVFDTVTRPILADEIGHTHEPGNRLIAAALTPHILRSLRAGGYVSGPAVSAVNRGPA